MKATPRRGTPAAWTAVVILGIMVGAAGWGVERKWRAQTALRQEALDALHEETARLTVLRDSLRHFLEIDPCAIPQEVDGVPLPEAAPAVRAGRGTPAPDVPSTPSEATPPTRI